jgi:hypothetical protein
MHGGGADLITVFEEQIKRERIVCGIVDTDRYSPDSGTAPKLESLKRIANQLNWPLAFAISPPCREAENCLPMELMMSVQSGKTNGDNKYYLRVSEHEIACGQDSCRAFWLFVDLKEGLNNETLAKISEAKDQAWLKEKLAIAGIDIEKESISGFGSRVFDQLAAHGQHLAQLRSLTRCHAWRDVFSEFVDLLVWIFAGGRRIAT